MCGGYSAWAARVRAWVLRRRDEGDTPSSRTPTLPFTCGGRGTAGATPARCPKETTKTPGFSAPQGGESDQKRPFATPGWQCSGLLRALPDCQQGQQPTSFKSRAADDQPSSVRLRRAGRDAPVEHLVAGAVRAAVTLRVRAGAEVSVTAPGRRALGRQTRSRLGRAQVVTRRENAPASVRIAAVVGA